MNKVIGGTPIGSKSMCQTCRYAQNIRGINMQERTICVRTAPAFPITFPILTCSGYDDKRQPSLYDMEQIAWNVQSRNRGPVGYAPDGSLNIEIQPPERQPGQQPPMIR